jgi:hypothetical protein
MSWSITVQGKGAAVAAVAAKELAQYKCSEPEEAIKGKVVEIVQAAGAAMPDKGLMVCAYGSMGTTWDPTGRNTAEVCNVTVRLELTTVVFAEIAAVQPPATGSAS